MLVREYILRLVINIGFRPTATQQPLECGSWIGIPTTLCNGRPMLESRVHTNMMSKFGEKRLPRNRSTGTRLHQFKTNGPNDPPVRRPGADFLPGTTSEACAISGQSAIASRKACVLIHSTRDSRHSRCRHNAWPRVEDGNLTQNTSRLEVRGS